LNLEQGTSGQLFGYGYLPLPLTSAKATRSEPRLAISDVVDVAFPLS